MAKIRKVADKYTKGVSKSTADKRKAEIRKRMKGKESYEPLAGDKKAKTKESKYTTQAKSIRNEIRMLTPKAKGTTQTERFKNATAQATGIPYRIIDEIYKRGQKAWSVGHRAGATQDQWSRARIYSFLMKGKTTTTGDADLFAEAKKILSKKGKTFNF